MEKYTTKQDGRARTISTLGGDYALKWDDETQMSVNAHAALLSQFAKAGGFLDRLVETCPMRLTSNNAPEVRDLVATVMVSMVNGATRFRHFDRLRGDAASAELFGVRRFMSCDSVRRNFASIPAEEALPWVWRENLRLLQDVVAEDYVLDLDPTVKPVYGRQEGAELGYSPQKPGRPSHCYHTLCIAELRMALAVVVHPGDETSGAHSRPMLAEYLRFASSVRKPRLVRGDVSFGSESVIGDCEAADVRYLFKARRTKGVRGEFLSLLAEPGAWRGSSDGWQCAERDVRLDSWARARRPGLERSGNSRRPRERLRRDEEPVGLGRLHRALPRPDRALRRAVGHRREPLEHLHAARRGRDAPRGRHVPAAAPDVHRPHHAPRAAGHRHDLHRHGRKGPRSLPRHQRVPREGVVCVAVDP